MMSKFIANENRANFFSAVWLTMLLIARQLAWFFTLTEEDRAKAGIYRGGEGRNG